jgi:hypothetical protein
MLDLQVIFHLTNIRNEYHACLSCPLGKDSAHLEKIRVEQAVNLEEPQQRILESMIAGCNAV